jgi:2-keto-3-deoxy-L-rhamnonate aldolase RhmA
MMLEQLGTALRQGQPVYGTLIVSHSPRWPGEVAKIGLDFVFIDTEHIALDRQILSWMCQAYSALNLPPIVRIPDPDPILASMVIDGGACGVMAPYVETPEQVEALVGAVKWKPLKGKRLVEHLTGSAALEPVLVDYLKKTSEHNLVIINVESVPALERLDDLLAVPGLDGVLIGPHDLSCSLGIPEQYHHPKFEEAIRTVISKCRQHQIGVGCHITWADGMAQEIEWIKYGMNLVVHQADILAFSRSIKQDVDTIREALK